MAGTTGMGPRTTPRRVPLWTRLALLWFGVVVLARRRRIVGACGVVATAVTVLLVAAMLHAVVTGDVDGRGEAVGVTFIAALVVAGWSCSGFRIDEHGISPHRFPLSRRRSRVAWGRVRRIDVDYQHRINGVLKVDYGPPGSRFVRSLDATMLGTVGILRCTQPLRIIASAAELGLLPPDLPVRMHGRPQLPSSRAAFRRLQRHHGNVTSITWRSPDGGHATGQSIGHGKG